MTSKPATEAVRQAVEATVTSKGQVTLPKAVRSRLAIHPGNRIRFTMEADGRVQVEQVSFSLDDLWRISAAREKVTSAMSFDEMNEAKARRIW